MKQKKCLVTTSFVGYGDLLAHTPFFRFLKRVHDEVHVWCNNPEPFLYNPNVDQLFRVNGPRIPSGEDFYYSNIFEINGRNPRLAHSHIHTTDYVTLCGYGIQLPYHEKHLEAFWPKTDMELVDRTLWTYRVEQGKFVVVAPTIGWPSRTLPFEYYERIIDHIAKHQKVVLVGKDVNPMDFSEQCKHLTKTEMKTCYDGNRFLRRNVVNLMGQLTFSQLCYLYSIAQLAVNTENGNMMASCTNPTCWNLYIPSITPPDLRLPFRFGSQEYRTIVVHKPLAKYPAASPELGLAGQSLVTAEPATPPVEQVLAAYDDWRTRESFA